MSRTHTLWAQAGRFWRNTTRRPSFDNNLAERALRRVAIVHLDQPVAHWIVRVGIRVAQRAGAVGGLADQLVQVIIGPVDRLRGGRAAIIVFHRCQPLPVRAQRVLELPQVGHRPADNLVHMLIGQPPQVVVAIALHHPIGQGDRNQISVGVVVVAADQRGADRVLLMAGGIVLLAHD
jgi:hypothetical protein